MVPPLNRAEVTYLKKFAYTRRMDRSGGPYFVDGDGDFGQGDGPDEVRAHSGPPEGQPGLWCQWEPSGDGTTIAWDGGEKFYDSPEWMKYIIDHFLRPGCVVQGLLATPNESGVPDPVEEYFAEFTFDHVCNGAIEAQGEDPDDHWQLVVTDNKVEVREGHVEYSEGREVTL